MSLVGTHSINVFTSPVNSAGGVNANLVRGNDNVLRNAYVAHDADATIHVQSSTLAARPAAGIVGRKWMTVDGTSVRMWYDTGATWIESGNVIGPASSTDNAVARYDGTTGKLIQDSLVTIADTGATTISAGTASPALTVASTGSVQGSFRYNASNRLDIQVTSGGQVTFDAVGTAPYISFADYIFMNIQSPAASNYVAAFLSSSGSAATPAYGVLGRGSGNHATGTLSAVWGVSGVATTNAAGGTTTAAIGVRAEVTSAGILVNGYGISVNAISTAMTNAYGLFIGDVTGGTSLNYAIYTGLGAVRFGGAVTADTTLTVNSTLTTNGTSAALTQSATTATVNIGTGSGSGGSTIQVRGAAGQLRSLSFQTGTTTRWLINADTSAEGGANSGSALTILARDDAGAAIDTPISITRAAGGTMTFVRPLQHLGATATLVQAGAVLSQVTVGSSTATETRLRVNGAVGTLRQLTFDTAGVFRWNVYTNITAESGADAGSSFNIGAYSDAGAFIDNPVNIVRAAGGGITMARNVLLSTGSLEVRTSTANPTVAIRMRNVNGTVDQRTWDLRTPTDGTLEVRSSTDGGTTVFTALGITHATGATRFYGAMTLDGQFNHNGITALVSQNATGNAALSIGSGTQTGGSYLRVRAPVGQYASFALRSGDLDRWVMYRDLTAESGGNVGSQFSLAAHTDAGAFIDNVIRINREAGGTIALNRPLSQTGAAVSLGQQTAAASILTLGAATTPGSVVIIRGTVAGGRYIDYQSGAVSRWRVGANTTAEAGANAGSNYFIQAHDDAGTAIDTPFQIFRAAGGAIQTSRPVDINVSTGLRVLGTKVVGAQGATIADPTGGVTIDTEARTAINALIDRLQAHGLIA